jgi:hypothetical protein
MEPPSTFLRAGSSILRLKGFGFWCEAACLSPIGFSGLLKSSSQVRRRFWSIEHFCETVVLAPHCGRSKTQQLLRGSLVATHRELNEPPCRPPFHHLSLGISPSVSGTSAEIEFIGVGRMQLECTNLLLASEPICISPKCEIFPKKCV